MFVSPIYLFLSISFLIASFAHIVTDEPLHAKVNFGMMSSLHAIYYSYQISILMYDYPKNFLFVPNENKLFGLLMKIILPSIITFIFWIPYLLNILHNNPYDIIALLGIDFIVFFYLLIFSLYCEVASFNSKQTVTNESTILSYVDNGMTSAKSDSSSETI